MLRLGATVPAVRITLVAANGYLHDRRARALRWSLEAAAHDVTVVAAGSPVDDLSDVAWVPTRRPVGPGRLRARIRRAQSAKTRDQVLRRGLVGAVARSRPQQVIPTTAAAMDVAVAAARRGGALLVADTRWPVADDVWATRHAPARPAMAAPVAGGLDHHTPGWSGTPGPPAPGRHAGLRMMLVYRRRVTSPGRYLHEALEHAGVEVLVTEDVLDVAKLPHDLDGIIIVESPYPAVRVTGPPAPCPVLLWVHHGEHHLETNLRLARRYGADHVLLAHSWHLASRFDVPVTRFPFGVPVHDVDGSTPFAARRHDVAMVGSHLDGGGPYARRSELVGRARAHLGEARCAFLDGVTPREMLAVYGDSRLVLNEGGTRHHPITMRVMEAIAAGALLVTDEVPGLDQLLDIDAHTVQIREPFEQQLDDLLRDPASATRAASAAAHGRALHSYDHRVDELVHVLRATTPSGVAGPEGGRRPGAPDAATLAGLVHGDPEVQVLVQVGAPELADAHPDREVWTPDELGARMQPGSMEASVVRADDVREHEDVLRAGWRYIYVDGLATGLEDWLAAEHPQAVTTTRGTVRRVDLRASGYVARPDRQDTA